MNEKCFGMNKKGECGVLTVKGCCGYGKCPFYKPRWKAEKDRKLAEAKLCALPADQQRHIADKYYKGIMPWCGEGAN